MLNPWGCLISSLCKTLLALANLTTDLLRNNVANPLHKSMYLQTLSKMKPNTTMNSNEDFK
jgi:hypothetical protein